ncbi:formate transporter FocA [Devriesea agamarum]|uniref:formate transporter FocA n=1 Tax=Devriesea agamarum TaxID=472569 RepID=UPI00071DFCB7|nr:formate transporter FocA [Devriesea agamarum]
MDDLAGKMTIAAPPQMAKLLDEGMVAKATKDKLTMFLLALSGGAFIGLGFIFYVTSQQSLQGFPLGIAKVIGGFVFSVGLIAVVLSGSDLFTGTTMTMVSRLTHKISTAQMLAHWGISYVGNLVGSLVVAVLIILAGTPTTNGGAWGVVVMNVANSKVHHTWVQSLVLGLLANFAVCLGVWLSYSGRSTVDKMLGIAGPIALFVASGFEHSVANMFMLPTGLLIKYTGGEAFWSSPAVTAAHLTPDSFSGLTVGTAIWNNLIPVTIGNVIGGALFIGAYFWLCYLRPHRAAEAKQALHKA